jgi:hypothetical protein
VRPGFAEDAFFVFGAVASGEWRETKKKADTACFLKLGSLPGRSLPDRKQKRCRQAIDRFCLLPEGVVSFRQAVQKKQIPRYARDDNQKILGL